MSAETAISWTDSTWNPAQGCTKVSAGCKFCYMYRDKARYGQDPTVVVRSKPGTFNAPIIRVKGGGFKIPGPLIFASSWTDVFHAEIDAYRPEVWAIIRERDRIEQGEGLARSFFQVLTKRADRIAPHLPPDWGDGYPNVWLGVTLEEQATAWRAEALAPIPAVVRFLSYEPACGPVDWRPILAGGRIDWLISGGESGGKEVRPAHPGWFRAARDACAGAGVAFHHKQHGEFVASPSAIEEGDYMFPDGLAMVRVGKHAAGRLLDGVTHDAFPVSNG